MPKTNPLAQIAKRLASLQSKSLKINEEISALVQIVDAEIEKQGAASTPVQVPPFKVTSKAIPTKATPAKVTPVKVEKTIATPKKKGRPAKK